MTYKRRRDFFALTTLFSLLLLTTSMSVSSAVTSVEGVTVLPANTVGAPSTFRIASGGLTQQVSLRVPPGYKPQSLQAAWQRTSDIRNATLTIEQTGRVVAAIPSSNIPLLAAPATLSLAGVEVVDDILTFDLRLQSSGADSACVVDSGVSLFDMKFTFTGDDKPSNAVNEFVIPELQKLEIAVPSQVTPAIADAALTIATAVARSTTESAPAVDVVTLPGSTNLESLHRKVVLDPQAAVGLRVEGKVLRIGGNDDELKRQADALASSTSPLLGSPSLRVTQLDAPPLGALPTKSRYSFDELGIGTIQLQGLGHLEQNVNFSQANLNGPIKNWRVRLVGNYTPNGKGSFSVLLRGTILRSVQLDDNGKIDETITIPASFAGRDPALTLRFDVASTSTPSNGQGSCINSIPFTGTISPSSALDIERGQDDSAGFIRWPQASLPTLHVAFDEYNADTLGAAVTSLVTMQRATTTPLHLEVSPTLDSQTPSPLFAVVTHDPVPDHLNAILPGIAGKSGGVRLVGESNKTLLELEPDTAPGGVTSYQATTRLTGNVLLLAGPSASAVKSLASTLAAQPNGWFDLTGDTWFAIGDQKPLGIQARGSALRVEPIEPATSTILVRHRTAITIGAVVFVVLILALLYPRLVQRKPTPPDLGTRS